MMYAIMFGVVIFGCVGFVIAYLAFRVLAAKINRHEKEMDDIVRTIKLSL